MRAETILRAYARASDRRRRALNVLNACFDGFWLGLLDRDALDRLDERFYGAGHDELDGRAFSYRDEAHNRSGLHDWELAAIERHFPAGGRVIVTGAGGGREVLALLERGYDAVGHEPNGTLVAAGAALLRRLGHEGRLHVCGRDAFPGGAGRCDAVLVGWGSYMLIPGRDRRVAFLRAARAAVPAGAPLLCSFFVRPPDARYHAILAGTANVVRRLRRREPVEVGDTIAENFAHRFTRAEIERELALGGFRMLAYEPRPYGHAVAVAEPASGQSSPTWRMIETESE
jgi:hypothetical protein